MRPFGKDQPDPYGSSGGEAVKSVCDDLGRRWVNVRDLADQGSQGFELFEAGDVRIVNDLPGFYGQAETSEGIIRGVRGSLRHWAHLLMSNQAAARAARLGCRGSV
jgi:hypothetical protein